MRENRKINRDWLATHSTEHRGPFFWILWLEREIFLGVLDFHLARAAIVQFLGRNHPQSGGQEKKKGKITPNRDFPHTLWLARAFWILPGRQSFSRRFTLSRGQRHAGLVLGSKMGDKGGKFTL